MARVALRAHEGRRAAFGGCSPLDTMYPKSAKSEACKRFMLERANSACHKDKLHRAALQKQKSGKSGHLQTRRGSCLQPKRNNSPSQSSMPRDNSPVASQSWHRSSIAREGALGRSSMAEPRSMTEPSRMTESSRMTEESSMADRSSMADGCSTQRRRRKERRSALIELDHFSQAVIKLEGISGSWDPNAP